MFILYFAYRYKKQLSDEKTKHSQNIELQKESYRDQLKQLQNKYSNIVYLFDTIT